MKAQRKARVGASFIRAASLLCLVVGVFFAAIPWTSSAWSQDVTIADPTEERAPGGAGDGRRVVVRFLTEGDFPPFNYLDDEGVLAGFNIDLARAICQDLGAACDIKVKPWDELLLGLKRGNADAVIAAHTVTAQALTEVDFTDSYFFTPGRFAARSGMFTSNVVPEELDGVAIGVARGTTHEAFLKAYFRDSKIVVFENPELAREALQQGKVELLFDDGISLAFWLNGSLARQCCEFTGGAFLEPKYFGSGIAIAVPRNDPEIKTLINAALKRVRQSGRFQELVERYFPSKIY